METKSIANEEIAVSPTIRARSFEGIIIKLTALNNGSTIRAIRKYPSFSVMLAELHSYFS
jgi:hypothetical protein